MKAKWGCGIFVNNSNKELSYKVVYSYSTDGKRVLIDEYFYQTPLIDHWVPVPLYKLLQNDPDHVRAIFDEINQIIKRDSKYKEAA